ncbi:MAG: tyrosine-type recombinase/integrase [Puniceicoccaceae bacterium]
MASVHKRKTSKFWYGAFRMNDGTLVFRSTKCTKKAEALRVAIGWEDAVRRNATEAHIRKVYEDLHVRIHGTRMRTDSVRDFFLRWIGAREKELAVSTCTTYRNTANNFMDFLGGRADRPIAELTVSDLTGFRDAEAKRTTPRSAQNRLKAIKPWIIDAWREGLLQDNIGTKIPRTKRQAGKIQRRPFAMDEVKMLLENASDEWQGMILMGLYTGQRLGDIARLNWSQVDLVREEIAFATAKTDRPMIIPIVGAWKTWLMDHVGDDPAADVFPNAAGSVRRSSGRTANLSNQFRNIMASAGLAESRNHQKQKDGRDKARSMSPLTFHCLRYTATTMLKAAGVPEAIARDIIGHESAAISRNYTKIDEGTKRSALEKLPETI